MLFNKHSGLDGLHALLSASKPYWLNYTDDKLDHFVMTNLAAARGTKLHLLAKLHIELGVTMPRNGTTLSEYINDAIGFKMKPEQPLVYSEFAFGTADCISFKRPRGADRHLLRIHDLKNGTSKASDKQLKVYAAYFCLEYEQKPAEIDIELRIYQNDEIFVIIPDPDDITHIMDRIVSTDRRIRELREEALA